MDGRAQWFLFLSLLVFPLLQEHLDTLGLFLAAGVQRRGQNGRWESTCHTTWDERGHDFESEFVFFSTFCGRISVHAGWEI
jgi:hypothetical protein